MSRWQFSDDSSWRRSHPDDPRTVADGDQIKAGVHDRINNATSFMAFTVPKDGAVEVSAIIEPEATSDDSEQLMRMIAYTLVRMFLDDIDRDDPLTQALLVHTFVQNMSATIAIVLREKGIVDD